MQQAEKKIRMEQRTIRRQAFEDEIDRSCTNVDLGECTQVILNVADEARWRRTNIHKIDTTYESNNE